jgi:hypothetical protein
VKKRNARSAKGRLRDNLKQIGDDLDRRRAELLRSAQDRFFTGWQVTDEWINRLSEVLEQLDVNKMRQEALEWLPKSGPKQNADESKPVDKYLLLMQECLAASRGNMRSARIKFMKEATARFCVTKGTAQNNWSRLGRESRENKSSRPIMVVKIPTKT